MKNFAYECPETIDQAIALLADNAPDARPMAGGTDMLVELKHTFDVPKLVVDLRKIEDLHGIELTQDGLRIGAMASHTEIMVSDLVAEHMPAAIDAAWSIGAIQTRNLGTLGGNLVTCVPSLDSGPVLVALDATVNLAGPNGRRQLTLEEFFVGPRKTALEAGEILVDIVIPTASLGKPAHFEKLGLRKGQALALVNAAAAVHVEDGKLKDPRIALGAVAPTVIRAKAAEKFLTGKAANDADALAQAGEMAADEAKPIDDFRASADYRRQLVKVLTRRCLEAAIKAA